MATNIGQLTNVMPSGGREVSAMMGSAVDDLAVLRATVASLVTDMAMRIANHNTLVAKLNLDVGVIDANYAVAGAITATTPAALILEK